MPLHIDSTRLVKRPALPVDAVLDTVKDKLNACGAVVLVAETGAGKTTRVPAELLTNNPSGQIVVLEPRRLAATLAARFVARESDCKLGQEVGYTVRFDDRSNTNTKVRFITSGVLLRRLMNSPNLDGISTVIFDEFHERHIEDDLLLAWVQRLRESSRPELKIIVMSATLNPARVARFLNAEVVHSSGRSFPVDIQWHSRIDKRPFSKQVPGALREAAKAGLDGDVLVFVDGVAEIVRCKRSCS